MIRISHKHDVYGIFFNYMGLPLHNFLIVKATAPYN